MRRRVAGVQSRLRSHCRASTSGRGEQDVRYILGIESSCDDTGIAILRASDGMILGQAIANQVCNEIIHRAYKAEAMLRVQIVRQSRCMNYFSFRILELSLSRWKFC